MTIRRQVVWLLVFSSVGLIAELLLTRHWDGVWQVAPLVLLGLGLLVVGARATARVVQGVMGLFILSGLVGSFLHYRGKIEFALERNPALKGWALVRETLKGASPPILAPGAMIAIGLLGLVAVSRDNGNEGRAS